MSGEEVTFGRFRFDLGRRQLSRDGIPVRLGSRALDVLFVLATARGNVITKDELLARVWPGQVVEENNLQVQVSALRKALDEEKSGQSCYRAGPGLPPHRRCWRFARSRASGQAVDRRAAIPEYEW